MRKHYLMQDRTTREYFLVEEETRSDALDLVAFYQSKRFAFVKFIRRSTKINVDAKELKFNVSLDNVISSNVTIEQMEETAE